MSELIIEREIWGFTPRHAPIRHMLSSNKSRWNKDVDLKDTSSLFDRQDNMFLTSSQAEKTGNCQEGSIKNRQNCWILSLLIKLFHPQAFNTVGGVCECV